VTEDQQLKKIEMEAKRKLHMQKMIEEQKKLTVDKILNDAGRKKKIRKEAEERRNERIRRRVLPEGDQIIKIIATQKGTHLVLPQGLKGEDLFNYYLIV
jgi:hypothetical protein